MGRSLALALLLATCATAGVRVTPADAHLASGSTCAFTATLDGAQPPGGWRWTVEGPGTIHEETGLYQAPEGAAAARVRAERRSDPAVAGEAFVLVLPLPGSVAEVVGEALGPGPVQSRLPFLDLETGTRPVPGTQILRTSPAPGDGNNRGLRPILVGCGVPFTFLQPVLEEVDGMRVSWMEGGELRCRDLDASGQADLVIRGRVADLTLEALKASVSRPGMWRSTILPYDVEVRGVVGLCGNAVAPGGHRDGAGLEARFQRPFGLVHTGRRDRPTLVVSDPGSHVLRTVTPEGVAATLAGQPGQAGHRNTPTFLTKLEALVGRAEPGPPLFHGPTHLAVRPVAPGLFTLAEEEILVADSGNHVIRGVRLDGKVTTIAGAPGQAGHRDSSLPEGARFNDPQGLAVGPGGRVFVADRGNRVIRVIEPGGAVGTLAGVPGEAGTADGEAARFTDLKGLCMHPRLAALYVLDGHAVRRVDLPGGRVTTLMGLVGTPGFQDLGTGGTGLPCLNDPTGIAPTAGGMVIADHGNHAVRILGDGDRSLRTLAGDPALDANRWGLLRDGLAGPLDERYASLEGPWTAASSSQSIPRIQVTSGTCLAELSPSTFGWQAPALAPGPPPEAAVGVPCWVSFRLEEAVPIQYRADVLDPDGQRRKRTAGSATGPATLLLEATFAEAGTGRVVLRAVTQQGLSTQAEVAVTIR